MFLIIGYVIVLGASVGTFMIHGSLSSLWVPVEYIAIIGLMLGGFVAGNDTKQHEAHVGDRRVGQHALDVGLGDGGQIADGH